MEFARSPCGCVGLRPQSKDMLVSLICDANLVVGVVVRVNGCLCLSDGLETCPECTLHFTQNQLGQFPAGRP